MGTLRLSVSATEAVVFICLDLTSAAQVADSIVLTELVYDTVSHPCC